MPKIVSSHTRVIDKPSAMRDFILLASVIPILIALPDADVVDRIAIMVLLIGGFAYRLFQAKMPFSPLEIGYYLAFWFVTLDGLDKYGGYGDGEQWLVYSFGAAVAVGGYLVWLLNSRRSLVAVIPLVLFVFPLTQAPFDLARNLIARGNGAPLDGIYVTKIQGTNIYGVQFDSGTPVRWIERTYEGNFIVRDNFTTGLGGGTMAPQYARADRWQRELVGFFWLRPNSAN
jgi:hypothetical protein